jgi:prolyl 4-hydroxylase
MARASLIPRLALVLASAVLLAPAPRGALAAAPMIRGADGGASGVGGVDGLLAGPADPEAEAALLLHPGESYYALPRIASLGGETPWVEQISWSPRAWVYHNFLTPEECAHLVSLARPHMVHANVVDKRTGQTRLSDVRTSTGHFLTRAQTETVEAIEERIAAFAMVPADHGEGMQILRYGDGQKYDAHFDYFQDEENVKKGGQRIATALLYLSDVEEGGETVFPTGEFIDGDPAIGRGGTGASSPEEEPASACARGKLHAKPRRGDALLFFSTTLAGREDDRSLHGGCPVIRGEKWTATKWMRAGPYGAEREMRAKAKLAERAERAAEE